MARLMRAHDWENTPLGPVASWPSSLKAAMRLLLTSRFEMWLGWGKDIHFFYNDAYRPTLGNKHPKSLGMPTQQLWPEIWPDVEPRLRRVYDQGEATWDQALLLLLNRHGYLEETYHTFSYSPLFDDDGRVNGVFCAVSEDTERVISERRMSSLRALALRLHAPDSAAEVYAAVVDSLKDNSFDLPFVALYRFDEHGCAHLAGAVGVKSGSKHAAQSLGCDEDDAPWPIGAIWKGEGHLVVTGSADLPAGAWDRPADEVLIVPVRGQGSERPLGALVVGLNPYRPMDDSYLSFVQLIAGQIAASLASAEVFESERRRAEALAEAVRLREEAASKLSEANDRLVGEVKLKTRESERMRALFQQAPSFMCMLEGPKHVFSMVNDAYRQLVGHRDLQGLTVREALPEIEGQGFFELLDGAYSTGEPFVGSNLKAMLQRQPGRALEERFLHLVYQPIKDASGEVQGIFVDGYDVTHQKRAEESLQALNDTLEHRVAQRTSELANAMADLRRETEQHAEAQRALRHAQRMESLGQLTGGIAHDFNNLLQVISGNLQLLNREVEGNERATARVRSALGGVARGAKLASQLLAFGRRQPLEPKVTNIGRFVRGIDDMLRRTLGEEIELESIVAGGLWNALLDPAQVENAILNLAINARDAMEGRGRLTIEASNAMLDADYARTHDEVRAGQYVLLAVTDTGCGMAPEIIEQVFEPFFSTKPEGKGTGLGLSMVYGFVKQSGGHVKLYSEVGHGTTVKLYFPRSFGAEEERVTSDSMPAQGGSETILVVEDDAEVREIAVGLLRDLGYRVLKASDATSAMHVVESGVPIDMIFTDVVMPGPMRSPELARRAKERLPGVAVLFTSGYTENAIVHGGRLDPGVELLSKPYTRESLARKIRHVFANRAQADIAAGAESRADSAVRLHAVRIRVMLVEDDEAIRTGFAGMLQKIGVEVVGASSSSQALERLARERFDALLTDVGLPGTSGISLAQSVRQIHPDMPVAFLTGDGSDPEIRSIAGAIVLMKPFFMEDLEQALQRLLPGSFRRIGSPS